MRCPLKAGERVGEAYQRANEAVLAHGADLDNGSLSPHLKECRECRQVAEAQREVWSKLDAWTPAPVPADFDDRLYARIEAYKQQSWWSRTLAGMTGKWSWKPAMPLAVACTALVAAFLLNSPLPSYVRAPGVEVRSESGIDLQQVERALDDLDMLKQLGMAPGGHPRPSGAL